jgi:hypothetical protein
MQVSTHRRGRDLPTRAAASHTVSVCSEADGTAGLGEEALDFLSSSRADARYSAALLVFPDLRPGDLLRDEGRGARVGHRFPPHAFQALLVQVCADGSDPFGTPNSAEHLSDQWCGSCLTGLDTSLGKLRASSPQSVRRLSFRFLDARTRI